MNNISNKKYSFSPKGFIEFLDKIEKLKCFTRHSWLSDGRRESVAEHSFRLTVMALLLSHEFPEYDMDHVLRLCIVHDFGEAINGDIPSFQKTEADEDDETKSVEILLKDVPEGLKAEISSLLYEFYELKTPESRLARALDKLEVVIQHNEADISTWIPLEYELNAVYAEKECAEFPVLARICAQAKKMSFEKVRKAKESL